MTLFALAVGWMGRNGLLSGWCCGALTAVTCLLAAGARGQSAATPASARAVLVEMATHAGVIFTGHVLAITRADALGYVDVRFHVDQAVRGCPKTGAYVLREWAGLWTGQAERYQVGEGYLMLLTARGASGLSAPVDGTDGAIPLLAGGEAAVAGTTGMGPPDLGGAVPEPRVDLRWLNARALRGAGVTGGPPSGGTQRIQRNAVYGLRSAENQAAPLLPADPAEPIWRGGGGAGGSGPPHAPGAPNEPVGPAIPPRPGMPSGPADPAGPDDPGGAGGWVGAIAPLSPVGGTGSVPAVTLSSLLTLLQSGGGSGYVAR